MAGRNSCTDCGAQCQGKRCRSCSDASLGRKPVALACVCAHCGNAYQNQRRSSKEGAKYCSRKCAAAQKRAAPFTAVHFAVCAHCRVSFVSRRILRYCSKRCSVRANIPAYVPVERKRKDCAKCGVTFLGHGRSIYCSDRCARSALRANAGHKHRDRARRAGVQYEPVNPMRVFNRDGWRCQVCGRATPKSRRGTQHPNSPELDHRIPLAQGGPHTYDNVQCACRACNAMKGSTLVVGQLSLWNQWDGGGTSNRPRA